MNDNFSAFTLYITVLSAVTLSSAARLHLQATTHTVVSACSRGLHGSTQFQVTKTEAGTQGRLGPKCIQSSWEGFQSIDARLVSISALITWTVITADLYTLKCR